MTPASTAQSFCAIFGAGYLKRKGIPVAKLIIAGNGNIGSMVSHMAPQWGHGVIAIATRSCIQLPDRKVAVSFDAAREDYFSRLYSLTQEAEGLAITIPTRDQGQAEFEWIRFGTTQELMTTTAAKGAHAYLFDKLVPYPSSLGSWAVVGGRTDMTGILRRRHLIGKRIILIGVVNATINDLLSAHDDRVPLDVKAKVRSLREGGYAEPGDGDVFALVCSELDDIKLKLCALFNLAFAGVIGGPFLTPRVFGHSSLTEDYLDRLLSARIPVRYLVCITNDGRRRPLNVHEMKPGSLSAYTGSWHIDGSFVSLPPDKDHILTRSFMPGFSNGFTLREDLGGKSFDTYLEGPGAGREVTAAALLDDLSNLFRLPQH